MDDYEDNIYCDPRKTRGCEKCKNVIPPRGRYRCTAECGDHRCLRPIYRGKFCREHSLKSPSRRSRFKGLKSNDTNPCQSLEFSTGVFPIQDNTRLVSCGDIHGDYDVLVDVCVNAAKVAAAGKDGELHWVSEPGVQTIFVQCGDIIDPYRTSSIEGHFDRFMEDKLFETVNRLVVEAHAAGDMFLKVMGNHEISNLDWIMAKEEEEYPEPFKYASPNSTCNASCRQRGWNLLTQCPTYGMVRVGNWLFSHGGIGANGFEHLERTFGTLDLNQYIEYSNSLLKRYMDKTIDENEMEIYSILFLEGDTSFTWDRSLGLENPDCFSGSEALTETGEKVVITGLEDVRMCIGHTIQGRNTKGLIPKRVKRFSTYIEFSGDLVKNEYGNCGINATCDGRVWRLDVGMSRSFDFNSRYEDLDNGELMLKLGLRMCQVIVVESENVSVRISLLGVPREWAVTRIGVENYAQECVIAYIKHLEDSGVILHRKD